MTTTKKGAKGGRSLILVLFGLPFFCFGLGFGYLKLWPEVSMWMQVGSWAQTQGELLSVKLDTARSSKGSTSYEVKAHYRYHVGSTPYEGTRVSLHGGKDNIGDYHQQWTQKLKQLQTQDLPVTVWYDPNHPDQALLDPQMRWGLMSMQIAFAVVFSLLGLVVMGVGLSKNAIGVGSENSVSESTPGLDFSQREPISPSAAKGHWGMWLFALLWNGISLPATIAVWSKAQTLNKPEDYLILLVLLFPLVGLILIWQALKGSLLHVRYGQSSLQMDPNPGQAGGQVGGEIALSRALPLETQCELRLECLHSRETRDSKGRQSTSTRVLWQDSMMSRGRLEAGVTRVQFLFDVPGDLPASQQQAKDWHHWRLHIAADIPGLDLTLDFEVPVDRGDQQSRIRIPGRERQLQLQRAQQLAQVLNTEQNGDTLYLNSAYGRERAGSIMVLVFGVIFFAAGVGIGLANMGPALIAIPSKLLFCGVFGGLGLLFMAIGVLTPTTRLDTAIDHQHIHVRRLFLGREIYRRSIPLANINALDAHKNSSSSAGSRTRNWFQIRVHHDGKIQPIAESIPGRVLADEALAFLRKSTGLP